MQELNLRYFQSVAKTGSLSAAAEELHVAVSAVSRQITNLEQRLAIKLFNRQPRGMQLTEAGRVLQAYALRNQLEISSVIAEMQDVMTRQMRKITVACPDGMAWHFLPSVISSFIIQCPDTRFDLHVVESTRASELVKEGEADIALTFSLSPDIGVKVISSHNAAISALMAKSHPLASKDVLQVKDLSHYPLTMSLNGSTMRYLFDVACSLSGIKVLPSFSCDSLGATYTMVCEHPNMIGLCSAVAVSGKTQQEGLVLKPIQESQLSLRSLQVQVMAERHLPAHLEAFVEYLEKKLVAAVQ
ncbi:MULTISPECIES: LysR family transcriptional regulator [unclassified Halomonas]|uniref:LysR family transcriptional regulator n=1 Tax=unclassified Halomonas TaxID=2609666 RepID=UPI00054E9D68|nr:MULTISPECIES: LysR family transcriptional regulator [unclassified Halomonas]CEP36463.1 Transcriptional regulator, LysR family [Halomonas sp. R57-5]